MTTFALDKLIEDTLNKSPFQHYYIRAEQVVALKEVITAGYALGREELAQLRAENARLTAEVEAADKLRDEIESWLKMLTTEIFREPDFVKARALLESGGMTLDGLSASNMRHVLTRLVEKDKQARTARLAAKE